MPIPIAMLMTTKERQKAEVLELREQTGGSHRAPIGWDGGASVAMRRDGDCTP